MFEVNYRLLDELQDSVIVVQGFYFSSKEAQQIENAVSADGLIFDRGDFHGCGTVIVSGVMATARF